MSTMTAPKHLTKLNNKPVRIVQVPLSLGAGRVGADYGPNAILMGNRLIEHLERMGYSTLHGDVIAQPAEPRAAKKKGAKTKAKDSEVRGKGPHHVDEIREVCESLAETVAKIHRRGQFPLVLGGDHSLAIGSVAGTAAHMAKKKQKIGLIWIDAHGDMNTAETSPTGNIHGMSMAINTGFDRAKQAALAPLYRVGGDFVKVDPQNAVLVGIRDVDHGEAANIARSGMKAFTIRDIDQMGMHEVMRRAIEYATRGTAGFHLSFDIDSVDPAIAPGVGTKVKGGLTYREAHLVMEMIFDASEKGALLSMDIVEMNDLLDPRQETAELLVELIDSAFGKRILHEWEHSTLRQRT